MDYANFPIAFTQTVNSHWFLTKDPNYKQQHKEVIQYILRTFGTGVEAIIYPELTENGMIHYHGFLKIIDKVKYRKAQYLLRKNLGYNYFKLIDNVEKWKEYCAKDKDTMEILLSEELPICHIEKIVL